MDKTTYTDKLYKMQQEYYKRPYKVIVEDVYSLLNDEVEKEDLSLVKIESRVKSWESIYDKLTRNNIDYDKDDIFNKITDIAGIRVICTLPTEIKNIEAIVNRLFDVHDVENKYQDLKNTEFGYFDVKYIVSLKNDHPHKGLAYLLCEIQITTAAMNLWADVSHLLLYKKEFNNKISDEIQREISAASALLYIADKQFDKLFHVWEAYISDLLHEYKTNRDRFIENKYTYETLFALLRCFFENKRHANRNQLFEFYEKTRNEYETIGELYTILCQTKLALEKYENDQSRYRRSMLDVGLLRVAILMSMMHREKNWENRMEAVKQLQKYDQYIE